MGVNSPLQHTNPATDKYCLECKHSAEKCARLHFRVLPQSKDVFVYQQVYIARGCECEREFKVLLHLPLSVSWYQLQPPRLPPTDGPVANARMVWAGKNTSLTLNVKKCQSAFIPNIIIFPNMFQGRKLLVARSK